MEVGLLTPAQHEQTVDLLLALHEHYHPGRALDRVLLRNHLLDNLCGPHSQIRLVTAELGGQLLGFAAIYLVYSLVEPEPAHQRQCVLKELFVSPRHRSQGIGLALMQWVARYALGQRLRPHRLVGQIVQRARHCVLREPGCEVGRRPPQLSDGARRHRRVGCPMMAHWPLPLTMAGGPPYLTP
jgi:GNAT superfamily N-acetyltransferase